jgi:hypothetical protein
LVGHAIYQSKQYRMEGVNKNYIILSAAAVGVAGIAVWSYLTSSSSKSDGIHASTTTVEGRKRSRSNSQDPISFFRYRPYIISSS